MHPLSISYLDIELTQRCNLSCPYCYLGQHKQTATISEETLEDCLDLLAVWGKVKGQDPTEISFYGGEPLAAFPQMRYFVEGAKARGYRLKYSIISNGTIAKPEIVDYCRVNNLSIQRSLDGCPSAMKLCRGEGTLDQYNAATPLWKDYGKTRRSTIIPETAKFICESLTYMHGLGFAKGMSPQPDYYADWSAEQADDFKRNLWLVAEELVRDVRAGRRPFYFYWFDREYAAHLTAGKDYRPSPGCGAGRSLWCCSWDGYLFICHRFSSEARDSEFCAGAVADVVAGMARGIGDRVKDCVGRCERKEMPESCRDCIGYYGCCRGCYHVNYKCTGDLQTPPPLYCELKRESARVVTWIDGQLRGKNPQWWKPPQRRPKFTTAKSA
jgi:sulfatase maturation enzyme AslB (radical SAM superfamily)